MDDHLLSQLRRNYLITIDEWSEHSVGDLTPQRLKQNLTHERNATADDQARWTKQRNDVAQRLGQMISRSIEYGKRLRVSAASRLGQFTT